MGVLFRIVLNKKVVKEVFMSNKPIVQALKQALADSYTLYLKTQNFHWNVTGAQFHSLHLLFETQYNDLALAVDAIAERIRALGDHAPGSFTEFGKLATVKEAKGVPAAAEMVKALAKDQAILVSTWKKVLIAAEKAGDDVTAGMATARREIHEKNRWMLESSQG